MKFIFIIKFINKLKWLILKHIIQLDISIVLGNGFGKIMSVDHINRHEILDNNNRMVIYCNEKTKNRYLNCFKKNQIFIRYQAKIANKRHELNGEGMKVSGMYIKLTKPIVQDIKCNSSGHYLEISIEVLLISTTSYLVLS